MSVAIMKPARIVHKAGVTTREMLTIGRLAHRGLTFCCENEKGTFISRQKGK